MARALSATSLSKYLEGGIYHDFLQYVKADKELAFEIRVKDEVMIYCQKNLLLRISHRKNASDMITMLNPRYYTNRKDGLKLSVQLREPSDLQDLRKVKQYFEDAKALCKNYKSHDEFIVQQQYKTAHRSFAGDYLAIDMEWAPDQAKIPVEYRLEKTKIDLIVVSNKPNDEGLHDIYLAEVKCGLGAVDGKSGIGDHLRMSQAVINNAYVRQSLLQDVKNIIQQKTQLQLFEGTPVRYCFSERPKIMFILAYSSNYERQGFCRIIRNLGDAGRGIKAEFTFEGETEFCPHKSTTCYTFFQTHCLPQCKVRKSDRTSFIITFNFLLNNPYFKFCKYLIFKRLNNQMLKHYSFEKLKITIV